METPDGRAILEYASNFEKTDTLNIVSVKWKNKLSNRQRKQEEKQLQEWLKKRLNLKQLEVRQLK